MSFETLERKAKELKMYIKIFNSKGQTKEFGVEYKELDQNDHVYDDSHLMSKYKFLSINKSYEIHWKQDLSFDEKTQLLYIYEILGASYPHNFQNN
jgi:hypothetical protein